MTNITAEIAARRREIIQAGIRGDTAALAAGFVDPSGHVRASAMVGLARSDGLSASNISEAASDSDFVVRRELARLGAKLTEVPLDLLLADPDTTVVEMAAWSCGEREEVTEGELQLLHGLCESHEDALCREAAAAALGAIGRLESLPVILRAASSDKATVRRRAVLALAPFDTPEVTAALEVALEDRDWQVRQAAEDLLS